jgi:hypothetical protein
MKTYILKLIREMVFEQKNNNWQGRLLPIINTLNNLVPGKPNDNICGFLAYDVPGKDRMKMKTGRFLTRKLGLNNGFMSDVQISKMADTINRYLYPDIEIRLDSGCQVTQNYKDAVGSSSCMTGSNSGCVGLYENNPGRFRQLIMLHNGNSARAIVHKLDCGKFLMDRVYSDSETLKESMIEYAKNKKWAYRQNMYPGIDDVAGIDYDSCIVSGLDYYDGEVPYMDTLTGYRITNGLLDIFHRNSKYPGDGTLDSTDGYIKQGVNCCNCNENVPEDSALCSEDGDYYCENCYCEVFSHCEKCDREVLSDDVVHIEDKNIYVCKDCAGCYYGQCEDCNNWYSETFNVNNGDKNVCQSCLDDYSTCDNCDKSFPGLDENNLCDDCAQDDRNMKKLAFVDKSVELTGKLFDD